MICRKKLEISVFSFAFSQNKGLCKKNGKFSPPPKHISYIPRPIGPIATSYLYQCACFGDPGSVVKPTAPLESAPTRSRLVRSLAAQWQSILGTCQAYLVENAKKDGCQLMVWVGSFGARWFGFLGSPYERDCYSVEDGSSKDQIDIFPLSKLRTYSTQEVLGQTWYHRVVSTTVFCYKAFLPKFSKNLKAIKAATFPPPLHRSPVPHWDPRRHV